jgi:hypothetical protein
MLSMMHEARISAGWEVRLVQLLCSLVLLLLAPVHCMSHVYVTAAAVQCMCRG